MIEFIGIFNFVVLLIFYFCYFYQLIYVFVSLFKKPAPEKEHAKHKYATIICARNEKLVIGELLRSINNQTYPKELIDVYVVADNCTDETADIARANGAEVIERNDLDNIGKGFAIKYAFNHIDEVKGIEAY